MTVATWIPAHVGWSAPVVPGSTRSARHLLGRSPGPAGRLLGGTFRTVGHRTSGLRRGVGHLAGRRGGPLSGRVEQRGALLAARLHPAGVVLVPLVLPATAHRVGRTGTHDGTRREQDYQHRHPGTPRRLAPPAALHLHLLGFPCGLAGAFTGGDGER